MTTSETLEQLTILDIQLYILSSLPAYGSLSRYDMFDFVRLIKFVDNQVFKMVKDFVPVRASATTGIIIKPHLLERGKIKQSSPVPHSASIHRLY